MGEARAVIPDSFDQESRGSLTPCCPSQPPTGWTVAETVGPELVWSWERGGEGRVSGIAGPQVLWALPLPWDGPRPRCGPHLPSRHPLHVPGAPPGGFPRPDELIYVRLCIRQDPRGPRGCRPAPPSLLRSTARASSLAGQSSRVTGPGHGHSYEGGAPGHPDDAEPQAGPAGGHPILITSRRPCPPPRIPPRRWGSA